METNYNFAAYLFAFESQLIYISRVLSVSLDPTEVPWMEHTRKCLSNGITNHKIEVGTMDDHLSHNIRSNRAKKKAINIK